MSSPAPAGAAALSRRSGGGPAHSRTSRAASANVLGSSSRSRVLRQRARDVDALEKAVGMEVVEIPHGDPRPAPVSERHVHAHVQSPQLLVEDVRVDGVDLARRERSDGGTPEIAEDEEAEGRVGVERLGRRLGSAPQPDVDIAGRRAFGHRGLLEDGAQV